MQSRASLWAVAALFVGISIPVYGAGLGVQEKVVLRFKPEAGQMAKSKDVSKISFDAMGQKVVIEDESTYQTDVLSADSDKYTLKSKILSSKTKVNGQPVEPEEDDSYTETTFAPNGLILDIKHSPELEDELQLVVENSVAVGSSIVFKEEAIGVGDSWTHDYSANAALKVAAATATFKVEALEELNGVPVAKIKMDWAEKSGSPALKVSSTQWIEVASGDSLKIEMKVTGAKFDFGLGEPVILTMESNSSRTSGGLIKSDSNQEDVPEQEKGAIDEAVDGFEKLEGIVTLWRKEEDGRTQLKMELKNSQLGQLMMMQTTASSGLADGRLAAGDPISDLVFEFRSLPNNRLAMYVPNYFYRADNNLPIAKAVQRSFPDAIVESFAIEAKQEDRDSILVDVSSMFQGDLGRITELLSGGGNPLLGGGGSMYIQDRENSYVGSVKNFPENLVVESVMNFIGRGGGGGLAALLSSGAKPADDRSVVVKVNYNLFALPVENGYQPRYFDSRVGFFTNDFQDFDDTTAIDQKVMYINRWNLKKKNPDSDVSDPVEPIVFWVDNSVPVEYRETVKNAIEGWNVAFLEAGFSNAVVAKQMPDDADFDHADMRYNIVRWVASPGDAYAIALFRTNPLTGQILNGAVTVDANIVRAFASEYGTYVRPEAWQARLKNRLADLAVDGYSPNRCDVMAEGNLNMLTGMMAASQMAGVSRDQYVKEFIRWVVGHEMGHMMGLRHNFVASTLLDLNQLGSDEEVKKEGTAASVMDYVAFNPSALKGGVDFFGQTVGRYDKWAIKYGYTPFGQKDSDEERYDLYQIAQMGTREGLAWLGDEYADGIDPYVTRFDLGADPLAYWSRMGTLSRQLMLDLPVTTMKPGQSYYSFTREFNGLMNMYARSASELTRFIGGVKRSPAYPNDPGAKKPLVNIDGKTQQAALDQVVKMTFAKSAFDFPKGYFKNFVMNPKGDLIESLMSGQNDFPMRDTFAGLQASILGSIMDPGTLGRVVNAEYEAEPGEEVLTLVDVFTTVYDAVWTEVASASEVSPLRRDLQRAHADMLMAMVLEKQSAPSDAVVAARWQLNRLSRELKVASGKAKTMSTAMHFGDLANRIDKALAAQPTIGNSGGGGGLSLADLLGGARKSKSGG